jgi:hypothetical protein
MKRQALTAIEIETLVVSTSAPLDEPKQSVSERATRGRSALGWFVDTLALAGCGMAGVHVGVWLDHPNVAPPPRLRTVEEEKQRHD